ncbi:hypothetical protein DD922_00280 [Staphylococcus pseudintermedius]|nr:hypothetical protein DD922_00280 [Staphylococcus pseudintermedius]
MCSLLVDIDNDSYVDMLVDFDSLAMTLDFELEIDVDADARFEAFVLVFTEAFSDACVDFNALADCD